MGGRGGGGGNGGGAGTSPQSIAARIRKMSTGDAARSLLEGRSKSELLSILRALGSGPREGSKATRADIIRDIVGTVTIRQALRQ